MADEVPNRGAYLDVALATTLYYWCLQENKMIPTHFNVALANITFKTRQDDKKIPSAIEFAHLQSTRAPNLLDYVQDTEYLP